MKILVSWLRDFTDVPGTPEEIARTMSVRGFAVEGIEPRPDGDAVLDFEITANRPDCMSVIGMAREVATAYGLALRTPQVTPPNAGTATPGLRLAALRPTDGGDVDLVIDDPDLCPRYVGAVVDVTVEPSPAWLQTRLQAAGIRPISNIVDITNYVLLELGHPMHAFDLAKLRDARLRIRRARQGEAIRTLDDQRRNLSAGMLTVADAADPVAVAGVMGGADSEVTASTTAIVLESAYFDPLSVRRTSKALGLKTEASMRFERGADPDLPLVAMQRACALIEAVGAGVPRGTVLDRYPTPIEPLVLRLRRQRIGGLLGADVPDADIGQILENLGFGLRTAVDGWDVVIPTRRVDVHREVDLIEEVARHYGFDRLPVTFPALRAAAPSSDPRIVQARRLRSALTGSGFSEAVTFGFMAEPAAAPFVADGDLVPIANPLSESFAVLRPSVVPGLVAAVAHNRRRQQRDVRLFEVGARFSRSAGERRSLGWAWTGAAAAEHWSGGARDVDFFDMQAMVARICTVLGIKADTRPQVVSWLSPGRSAAITCAGAEVGVVGQLLPAIGEAFGLPAADIVYVAELDLDATGVPTSPPAVQVAPLPRFPSVTRDVSVLVDDTLEAERLRATITGAAPPTLVRVREFDRYQGKGIPGGKVSLSLRLTFQSPDRTLTDAEVQTAMEAILDAVIRTHGAVQR